MHKAFLLTLVLLLTIISGGILGKTPEELIRNEWPNTVNAFGKNSKNVPSHYIFVVDISDERFGEDIVKQIEIFTEALPKNDKITIIQLGPSDETKVLVVTTDINQEILKEIKNKFQKLVSEDKFGTEGSDGFKMIKLILKNLKAPGTGKSIPFVFIFSDLEYYPYKSFPTSSQWMSLSNEFQKLNFEFTPFIKAYILDNPKKSPRGDYKPFLNRIFPDMEIGDVDGPYLLKKEFTLIQAEIFRKKMLEYVNSLVSKQNASIQLQNNGGQIELKKSDSLVYHKLVLDYVSKNKVSQILKTDKLYSFLPPLETQIEVSGTLVAEKYNKEIPELTDIQLKNQKVVLLTADSLIPWWLTDTIALILLLSIWRYIWTIIPPARLKGTIDFFMQGKSTVVLDCGGRYKKFSNNEVTLLKSGFSLEIRATKKFFKGKCLILIPVNGDLLLSSRKQKKTARGGKKTIASVKSRWNIDGIEITMPTVK
ncbi:MAG: hypothetical protein FJX80_07435 [Bacteroidetes bacterium]|nr:hypothetical protein [Bacteroidota bacterium]